MSDKKGQSDIVGATTKAVQPDQNAMQNARREEDSLYQPQNISEHLAWETLKMKIQDNKAERELRKGHANKSFWLTLGWASFISLLIILKGVGCLKLDKVEFLSVIGALTTSVFGFYLLVMKFLFSRDENKKSKG